MDDQTSDNGQNSNSVPAENNQNDFLDGVKKRALESLTPLLGSLDTDPERKFDICINAMRLTDNKGLADTALSAALAIEEKGTKAEALVELVNEINYLQKA
jgi:hypothetical protein